nr:MAG TPA_asm: hypothetical protein [Caudoviricetes sp.]
MINISSYIALYGYMKTFKKLLTLNKVMLSLY